MEFRTIKVKHGDLPLTPCCEYCTKTITADHRAVKLQAIGASGFWETIAYGLCFCSASCARQYRKKLYPSHYPSNFHNEFGEPYYKEGSIL